MMTSILNLFNVMNVFAAAQNEPETTFETTIESLVEKIIHEKQEELAKQELNLKIFSTLKKGYTFLGKNNQDIKIATELLEKTEEVTTLIIDKLEELNQTKAIYLENFSIIDSDDRSMVKILKDCDDVEAESNLFAQKKEQMMKLTHLLYGVITNNKQVIDESKKEEIENELREANEEIDNIFDKLTSM